MNIRDIKHLLDDFGEDLTFSATSGNSYDPTTGANTQATTNFTVRGHFHNYQLQEIDGGNILMGDRKVTILPEDISGSSIPEPSGGDTFTVIPPDADGAPDKVTVVSVRVIMSGTSPICYICQVRE